MSRLAISAIGAAAICCCALAGCAAVKPSVRVVILPGTSASAFSPPASGTGPFWTQWRQYGWAGGQVSPAPEPAPTQQASVTGKCIAGYEPAYPMSDGSSLGGYGPFTAGRPARDVTIGGVPYPPVPAYRMIFTNNGTATAQVSRWVTAFSGASGQKFASDQVTIQPEFLPAGQSRSWTFYGTVDMTGRPTDPGFPGTGAPDEWVPYGGFTRCHLLTQ